jgi:AraC-like DNA-binding protein
LILNLTPAEHLMRRTNLIAVGKFQPEQPSTGSGLQRCPHIRFMRATVKLVREGNRLQVCTPNEAEFRNIGDGYQRCEIESGTTWTDWIAISPSLLKKISLEVSGQEIGPGDLAFPKPHAPLGGRAYLAQRYLFEALSARPDVSDLAVEDYVLKLLRVILSEAFSFWTGRSGHCPIKGQFSEKRRNAAIEKTKEFLGARYRENLSLTQIAENAYCCVAHLSRIFVRKTGFTVHAYQEHLRLRASLNLLRESRFDLSAVATHLGFAHHSHFSAAFRRRFGITPSKFVRMSSQRLHDGILQSTEHQNRAPDAQRSPDN